MVIRADATHALRAFCVLDEQTRQFTITDIARMFDVPLELIDGETWRRRHAPVPFKKNALKYRRRRADR